MFDEFCLYLVNGGQNIGTIVTLLMVAEFNDDGICFMAFASCLNKALISLAVAPTHDKNHPVRAKEHLDTNSDMCRVLDPVQ